MSIRKCLKTSAVFIGTLIGAGFATGREILLFFGRSSPVVPLLSAFISGVFCSLFLQAGYKGLNIIPSKGGKLMLALFFIAVMVVYSAMISATDELISDYYNFTGSGPIVAVIIGLICIAIKDGLKWLNSLVVPMIVIMIVMIYFKAGGVKISGGLNIQNAFAYASLNVFIGGFLVSKDGRIMNKNEILFTGAVTAAVLAAMTFMLYVIVIKSDNALMPVYDIAKSINLQFIAASVIFLAVISTMAGCFEVLAAIGNALIKNIWVSGAVMAAAGILIAIAGFKIIIDYGYPLVSFVGLMYTISVIATIIKGHNNKSARVMLLEPGKGK